MRKLPLFVILLLSLLAQSAAGGIDVIVLVDTSASMFSYYDELVEYLIRDLI